MLLNVSNSDCRVLYGSDTSHEYVEAEEENGHPIDEIFFKYMCGMWITFNVKADIITNLST